MGNILAREAGLVGLFGVDAVAAQRGHGTTIYPLEVNPRYTASVEILERAGGYSFVQQHVDACGSVPLSGSATPKIPESALGHYWGKRILFADEPTVFDNAMVARLSAPPTDASAWFLADTPNIGVTIEPGAPILTLIAAGDSSTAVQKSLGFPEN
jgi:predicted ATP-grasp superfamily ATP-dependent carboligase